MASDVFVRTLLAATTAALHAWHTLWSRVERLAEPPAASNWVWACIRAGVRSATLVGDVIMGGVGDLEVRVEPRARVVDATGRSEMGARIVVFSERRTPGFTLRSVNLPRADPVRVDDLQTGDEAFDGRFEISGAPPTVLALLDADARKLLITQDRHGGVDVQGRECVTTCSGAATGLEIEAAVRGALEIADRLSRPVDVRGALVERAAADPVPGVRCEAMRVLGWAYSGDAAMKAVAREALNDPDADVRIQAAAALGEEGAEVLRAHLAPEVLRDVTVASAVLLLGPRVSVARAIELLGDARDRRRLTTARACLQRLGHGPADETLGPLVAVLKADKGELATAAARALGVLGSPAAESVLVVALVRDPPDLRHEAALALGRLGTVSAVVALKEAEKRSVDPEFVAIARRSIAAIQSRAVGAEAGQLTLSDGQSGRLSLAAREAGQLSDPEAQAGRLSPVREPTDD